MLAEAPTLAPSIAPAVLPLERDGDVAAWALVDADIQRDLAGFPCVLNPSGYAQVHLPGGSELLHRFILGLRRNDGLEGHHVNGERLDCRRANLEIVTPPEHKLAHGGRPRLGGVVVSAHPAVTRGLVHWLDEYRVADAPKHETVPVTARPKRLPKTLNSDEVERLMAMPNLAVPTGLRDRCILALMLRCGLRASETCLLAVRDVDWKEGTIRLRPEITKYSVEAVVYLDPPTLELLRRWKDTRRPFAAGQSWLFVQVRAANRGEPLDRRLVYKMVVRRARKAGIKHVHPHMLRHTFATDLLREGFNIREVQQLMRHADIKTTAIYTHIYDDELQAKIRARA